MASPLGSAGALGMAARAGSTRLGPASKTPHLPAFVTSSPLGSTGPLKMAARARSDSLGRSERPLEPARLHWGAQSGRSNWLGSAKVLEIARPGCSKTLHLPTWLHWGARHWRSRPLGSARTRSSNPLGSAGPETLHWAGPRMPVALNTETNILVHGMHGSALVYICIHISVSLRHLERNRCG